jgi:TolB protein
MISELQIKASTLPLLFTMRKFISLLLFPFLLFSQDLEVRLPTRSSLKPIYVSDFGELRSVLEYDLNVSGYCTVLPKDHRLEQVLQSADVRNRFDLSLWKKEKIPFCLAASVVQNRLEVTAFNIEQGTSKKYSSIPLERQAIHQLADAIQKDLFGKGGINSLKLIYTVRTKNGTEKGHEWLSEVWVSDSDGWNARQLTKEKSYCLSPYFLPHSGDEFFYVSEKNGQSKIYKASLSHPQGELMIDLRGNQALPSFSKKGNQMAFITDVAGRPDLFLQSFDERGRAIGKPRQLFSAPRATQATPTFSPDGKQIAFVSDKDGPPRIYVLNVASPKNNDRAMPRLLTKKNRENTSPAWSPDGTKLAYSAKVDGFRQIWVYDFLTEEEVQLTTGAQNKENPAWAPDSFHLVYNTESDDTCELYLIHLNQGEPVQISHGPEQKRFASWQQR